MSEFKEWVRINFRICIIIFLNWTNELIPIFWLERFRLCLSYFYQRSFWRKLVVKFLLSQAIKCGTYTTSTKITSHRIRICKYPLILQVRQGQGLKKKWSYQIKKGLQKKHLWLHNKKDCERVHELNLQIKSNGLVSKIWL